MRESFQNYREIKDDVEKGKKTILIIGIISWVISSIILTIVRKFDIFNYFLLILALFFALVVSTIITVSLVFLKVKTIVSNEKIEFYIGKRLYFKTLWNNLEKINIFQEKFYDNKGRIKMGYALEFIGPDLNKIVRLWCCFSRIDKQKLIVRVINDYATKTKKLEIIERPPDDEIKLRSIECEDIEDFISNNK